MIRQPSGMKRTLLLILACAAVGGAVSLSRLAPTSGSSVVLAKETGLNWYRGNMHTHSLWSDGDDYLEGIGLWYRDNGYDFLVFTDHNVLATTEKWVEYEKTKGGKKAFERLKERFPDWVEERETEGKKEVRLRTFPEVSAKLSIPGEFLLIQGEEISDKFDGRPMHMNASNVREVLTPRGGMTMAETIQNNVDAVMSQRVRLKQPMLPHLNHPNFHYAITAEDLLQVRGEKFFEVYNGIHDCFSNGDQLHASTERIWDVLLAFRLKDLKLPVMYGLATDDSHNYHEEPGINHAQPGRGWVMVLADELQPDRLIEAMEAGRFYSSTGVTLSRVVADASGLTVEVAGEEGIDYQIEFIGTKGNFPRESEAVVDQDGKPVHTTRKYSPEIGKVLSTVNGTKGTYQFQPDDIYVRARVTSTKPHRNPSYDGEVGKAWVQPALGPAAAKDDES